MYSVKGDATIAAVTELRRELPTLLERVDRGESVVLQKNNEPVGVLLGYHMYQDLMRRNSMIENLALAITALKREDRVLNNRDDLVSLADMLTQYGVDPDDEGADDGTETI